MTYIFHPFLFVFHRVCVLCFLLLPTLLLYNSFVWFDKQKKKQTVLHMTEQDWIFSHQLSSDQANNVRTNLPKWRFGKSATSIIFFLQHDKWGGQLLIHILSTIYFGLGGGSNGFSWRPKRTKKTISNFNIMTSRILWIIQS